MGVSTVLKRVVAGAGIAAAIMVSGSAMASAQAPADQAATREIADSGSSELGRIVMGNLINFPLAIMNALQTASGGPPCTAPLCGMPM